MNIAANPLPRKSKQLQPKEKTAREKALEFARNVPKPKPVKVPSQMDPSDKIRQDNFIDE